jgi:hypothetical protein
MAKQFGYLATWFPGTDLKLGLIGVMDGKTFVPKSSIRSLGVSFRNTRDDSVDKLLQFKSSKSIDVQGKAKGTVSNIAPSIPEAKAGLAVAFGNETGVVFSAQGVKATRIDDVLSLERAIWDLWDRYLWDESWVIITELLSTQRCTILISEGGRSKVELEAKGAAGAGGLDIADLSAGFKLVSSRGMHTQIVGEAGLTPLFRAIRVKDSFWKGTRIEGARAPAPPTPPGVAPRRGVPRPSESMTEPVSV